MCDFGNLINGLPRSSLTRFLPCVQFHIILDRMALNLKPKIGEEKF